MSRHTDAEPNDDRQQAEAGAWSKSNKVTSSENVAVDTNGKQDDAVLKDHNASSAKEFRAVDVEQEHGAILVKNGYQGASVDASNQQQHTTTEASTTAECQNEEGKDKQRAPESWTNDGSSISIDPPHKAQFSDQNESQHQMSENELNRKRNNEELSSQLDSTVPSKTPKLLGNESIPNQMNCANNESQRNLDHSWGGVTKEENFSDRQRTEDLYGNKNNAGSAPIDTSDVDAAKDSRRDTSIGLVSESSSQGKSSSSALDGNEESMIKEDSSTSMDTKESVMASHGGQTNVDPLEKDSTNIENPATHRTSVSLTKIEDDTSASQEKMVSSTIFERNGTKTPAAYPGQGKAFGNDTHTPSLHINGQNGPATYPLATGAQAAPENNVYSNLSNSTQINNLNQNRQENLLLLPPGNTDGQGLRNGYNLAPVSDNATRREDSQVRKDNGGVDTKAPAQTEGLQESCKNTWMFQGNIKEHEPKDNAPFHANTNFVKTHQNAIENGSTGTGTPLPLVGTSSLSAPVMDTNASTDPKYLVGQNHAVKESPANHPIFKNQGTEELISNTFFSLNAVKDPQPFPQTAPNTENVLPHTSSGAQSAEQQNLNVGLVPPPSSVGLQTDVTQQPDALNELPMDQTAADTTLPVPSKLPETKTGRAGNEPAPVPPGEEGITTFGENDVLSGRGGGTNVHPGNRNFRDLINQNRRSYLRARKNDKPAISRAIVRTIREANGRFLKKDEKTGMWLEIGDDAAREKTSQALRQRAPEMRKLLFDPGQRAESNATVEEQFRQQQQQPQQQQQQQQQQQLLLQQQQMFMGMPNPSMTAIGAPIATPFMNPAMFAPNPAFLAASMAAGHPGALVMSPMAPNPQVFQQMFNAALLGNGMNRVQPTPPPQNQPNSNTNL